MKRTLIFAPLSLLTPLKAMMQDLRMNRLDVVKMPAPEPKHSGHGIRVVMNQNPEWYQELCSRHTVRRKNRRKRLGKKHHDTKIRRRRILEALAKLCAGIGTTSNYAFELLCLARDTLLEWEELREQYGS